MKAAIYARVSTEDQNPHMQLLDLRGFAERMGYEAVEYIEKESSAKRRPVFDRMLDDARLRKFDIVLVWKIDRFARSMQQFVNTVTELSRLGICLRAITQNVSSDQNDPMGKFLLGLLSLLAELERNIIVERVRAGMKAAKHRGVHCGRRRKIFPRDKVVELYMRGKTLRAIAKETGQGFGTIQRFLTAAERAE
jgi:DNA invertase Pin-like site-specific DNA recombinase